MSDVDRDDVDGSEVEREVVTSRRHVMFLDADGYTIWRLDVDDAEPLATFPGTDEGLDGAMARWDEIRARERRTAFLTITAWFVVALGALWIGMVAALIGLGVVLTLNPPNDVGEGLSYAFSVTIPTWSGAVTTTFFVSVGVYVVMWMHFRRRDP